LEKIHLDILYRDEILVAVNKPSGISVHKGWDRSNTVMVALVRDQLGEYVFPVHRLDRSTSGVLLFALNKEAAKSIQEAFQAEQIQKRYIALVRGIAPEYAFIDNPVPSKPKGPRVPARTECWRLDTFERYSVVAAQPKTGRLHQIRRHLKHITHPLIGDVNYGKGEHNRYFRKHFNLHRLALHALEILFPHPETGEILHIIAPPTEDILVPFQEMGIQSDVWQPQLSLVKSEETSGKSTHT